MSGYLRTEVAKKLSALNEPDGSEDMWPSYLEDADAAIAIVLERLKEPDEQMVEAGCLAIYDQSGDTNAREVWKDMLAIAIRNLHPIAGARG